MAQLKNHICFNSVMTLLFPLATYLILQSSVQQEWSCVVVMAKKIEKTLLEALGKALALLMKSSVVAGINFCLDFLT